MKKYLSVVLSLAVLVTPLVTTAQTDIDPSGDSSCAILTTNLRYGMRDSQANGNSVSILQDFLYSNSFLSLQPTGFFGSLTRTAVISFQNKYGIQATPPGFVGSLTRAKIQEIDCGVTTTPVPNPCPLTDVNGVATHVCPQKAPVISGLTGPQTLETNQTGKWVVTAYDSSGGSLSYSVNWGESSNVPQVTATNLRPSQQSAVFTHSYSLPGTYTPTFTVDNTRGQGTKANLSVLVVNLADVKPSKAPIVSSIAAKAAPAGTVYAGEFAYVNGTGLGGPLRIFVDGVEVSVVSNHDTDATFAFPSLSSNRALVSFFNSTIGPSSEYKVTVVVQTAPVPQGLTISSLSPISGPSGTLVTLSGSGFGFSSNTVHFGPYAINATPSSLSGNSLTFTVPGTPTACTNSYPPSCNGGLPSGAYNIFVTNPNGTSNSVTFTVGDKISSVQNSQQTAEVLASLKALLEELSRNLK